ncbi:hypothetical protein Pyn_18839 [Prunus yedoensis var. nudiflora]|uniref:Uncharacterized protein n=1 Tax=Prunus yedoensis var. nudiflora TaxID=2094558 RepID=A0A314Z6A2_PRUYE|nr:hypothetical protein Pyn_18839 [Prunus yedoensis var. nudiflora]
MFTFMLVAWNWKFLVTDDLNIICVHLQVTESSIIINGCAQVLAFVVETLYKSSEGKKRSTRKEAEGSSQLLESSIITLYSGGDASCKATSNAGAWPGKKAALSPKSISSAHNRPWQGVGPISLGKPTSKIGLGCCPQAADVSAGPPAHRNQRLQAT